MNTKNIVSKLVGATLAVAILVAFFPAALKSQSWNGIIDRNLSFDASATKLSTNNAYNGVSIEGVVAGGTIAQWDVVYLNGSSQWVKADANGSGTYPGIGLAVAAYSSTDPARILTLGVVRNDAWSWTPGGTVYLSDTAGLLVQTPPSGGSKVQAIGTAVSATIIFLKPSSDYGTSPL